VTLIFAGYFIAESLKDVVKVNLLFCTSFTSSNKRIGVNNGGTQNHSARDANVIRPPDFDHLRRENGKIQSQNTPKSYLFGALPRTPLGELTALP